MINSSQIYSYSPTKPFSAFLWSSVPLPLCFRKSQFPWELHVRQHLLCKSPICQIMWGPPCTHSAAIEHIAVYLRVTCNDRLILDPNRPKYFKLYADTDFCGNWYRPTVSNDPSTAKSRSGYVTLYAGFPIVWASKLQTLVALSSTEAECISLSPSLRYLFRLTALIK